MKTRILLLIALALVFSLPSRAQNCSYGSYQLTHSAYSAAPCGAISQTNTYAIWCTNTNTGGVYFQSTSTVTGTGQNYCATLLDSHCPPVLSFQEVDGITYTVPNRFYNRAYNYTANVNGGCTQSTFSQDFQQCHGVNCGSCHNGCGTGCTPIIVNTTGGDWTFIDHVSFDLSSNGIPEFMSWPTGGLAFLVVPDPETGLVLTGLNMFGPQTGNGFKELDAYDTNGDGELNGHELDPFMLWRNDAGDGICKKEEMHTLASMGITSLSLKYSTENRKVDGDVLRYRALLASAGGRVHVPYYDVILKFDNPPPVLPGRLLFAPSQGSPLTNTGTTSCMLRMPWNGGRC